MAFSLNPATDKFMVEIGNDFFPDLLTKKYDKYLRLSNGPLKNIKSIITESIQTIDIPGINLSTIQAIGLQNLGDLSKQTKIGFPNTSTNRTYPGTASDNEITESNMLTMNLRNTLINWMYCYEVLYSYYKRTREISQFYIILTLLDSSEIPLIEFKFSDCFIGQMPGLQFAYNSQFRESKNVEVGFIFNKFDTKFLIPEFDVKEITI